MGLGEVLSLLVEFSHCEMDQLINCIDEQRSRSLLN